MIGIRGNCLPLSRWFAPGGTSKRKVDLIFLLPAGPWLA